MKKKLIKVLPSCLVLSFVFLPLEASSVKAFTKDSTKQHVILAQKLIVDFYENKDLGKKNDLKKYIKSTALISLLNDKSDLHQYVSNKHSIKKINYKVTPTLIEEKNDNSNYYLKFAVKVEFNYANLEKVDSCYSEEVEIILNKTNDEYNILDFYSRYNYYDLFIRGDKLDLANNFENSQFLFENNSTFLTNTTKDKQKLLREKVDLNYEQEKVQPVIESQNNSITTLSSLNKNAIADYARNNYYKDTPSSGNGVVPYYDFFQISGNYDCTNFVSHALLAGGATVYNNGSPSTGWYYVNLNNRSYFWSSVNSLYSFLTTNTTKGPAGRSISYYIFNEQLGYPFERGDILQHHDGSTWIHSTIITGYYLYSGYTYFGALVTGRAGVDWYNDNEKAEEIYPGYNKRVIKLTGNY